MINKKSTVNLKEMESYIVKKRFISKRNEVYLIDLNITNEETSTYVLKKFIIDKESKSKEAFLLKTLKQNGLNVPGIYFEGTDYLVLEYIKGYTLLEKLTSLEREQRTDIYYKENYRLLHDLFKWLQMLYKVTDKTLGKGYILGDINFRNFIVNDKIYGIDLEDCSHRGYKEMDGGKFCAYLLTYRPSFTDWKIELTKLAIEMMTKEFNYTLYLIKKNMDEELKKIEARRNIKVDIHKIRQIFNT